VVDTLKAFPDITTAKPGTIRDLKKNVKNFMSSHNIKIVVSFGGDVGAGFGVSATGVDATWGFSTRPIYGRNINAFVNTKMLKVGLKLNATAKILGQGAKSNCEFSIGILGGGDQFCKLDINIM